VPTTPRSEAFDRYVEGGVLPADWGGDVREISGKFGE